MAGVNSPPWKAIIGKTKFRIRKQEIMPSYNRTAILNEVEKSSLRSEPLTFEIGDTVNVHTRIQEGEKERIQIFNGVVIARRGSGTRELFTVRRIVAGEGVERSFPIHSPKIAKLEVVRSGKVRRAKLFYLRDRMGKSVRLVERRSNKKEGTASE
jgi:large subunit ribosomal protein L19